MLKPAFQRPPAWSSHEQLVLSPTLTREIENALESFQEPKPDYCFSPAWCKTRESLHDILENGVGVVAFESPLLRSLERFEFERTYRTFCAALGTPVSTNLQGQTMKEVRDEGQRDSAGKPARGHLSNQELAFHSDRADLTALVCWEPSAKGGEFRVTSSVRVIEAIERSSPSLKNRLMTPIAHDLRNEGCTDDSYALIPVLSEKKAFVMRYIRKFNESVQRFGLNIPESTIRDLDALDEVIARENQTAEFRFTKGMVTIVNNHTTLHSRNAFENSSEQTRCLLRCWLSSEFTRELPQEFLPIFHDVRGGVVRGGIQYETQKTN
jgi:Taurine catabolism dioxygenase TauD, TfdA family